MGCIITSAAYSVSTIRINRESGGVPESPEGERFRMTTGQHTQAKTEKAQKRGGPKTAAGKARSRMNAVKHGLSAKQVVLPGEDPDEFEALRESIRKQYQPLGPATEQLVDLAATNFWRLMRARSIEVGLYISDRDRLEGLSTLLNTTDRPHPYLAELREPIELEYMEETTEIRRNELKQEFKQLGELSKLGEVFGTSQRALLNLSRLETTAERACYRAIAKLETLQAERSTHEPEMAASGNVGGKLPPRRRTKPRPG